MTATARKKIQNLSVGEKYRLLIEDTIDPEILCILIEDTNEEIRDLAFEKGLIYLFYHRYS